MKSELNIKTAGNKNNPAIIFVHGFPFDLQLWEEQIKELKSDYYCLAYDVRGLGKSPVGDGQFTIETFADDLIYLIESNKLENPVVCGMSMGGYIILRALEKREELFGGAILIDTKSGSDNDNTKIKRAEAIKKIKAEGLSKFNKEFINGLFWDKTLANDKKLVDKIIRRANKAEALGVKGAVLAMVSRTDTTENLSELNLPVLVLCGKYDKVTTPEIMEEMSNKIKYSEYHTVPKSGHMAPIENFEFVNKKIKTFLKNIL